MEPPRIRLTVLFAAVLAATLVLAACSSDSDGGDSDAPESESEGGDLAPGSAAINIVDLTFEPTTITIAAGSTDIAITNADTVDHTFTLDDDTVDAAVSAGQNITVTIELAESVGFHCEIHPSMTGTLQVA
jgi:plastocyanin